MAGTSHRMTSPARPYRVVKRMVDVIVALTGLLVLSPVLVIVALLVRSRLGSPVLFVQDRVGRNERVFRLRKFRSMTDRTDAAGVLLPDADRLTRFGALLRSTSLDELPELWNVVMGDMSLVGPRPLHVRYLDRYSDEQKRRHEVRPGITGLAQVNGRNSLSWDERFQLDVRYVDEVSARVDISILQKTVSSVLRREGISEEGGPSMTEFKGSS
jgi:undecaprenyl phosphate N,N'-diacetylbacillosamine 1-phosphate transferase